MQVSVLGLPLEEPVLLQEACLQFKELTTNDEWALMYVS